MAIYRVQAEFPYFTSIPKDVAVNTFHVACVPPLSSGDLVDVCEAVRDFYNVAHGGAAALSTFLATPITRAANQCSVSIYNLDDPEPRPPLVTTNFTLGAAAGTNTLPLEASVCLSYNATYPSGEVRARRRGRIYFGPLNSNAVQSGDSASFPQPSTAVLNALRQSASWLLAEIPSINPLANWCVYSRVNGTSAPIVAGWTDNAWDTQRRRGNAPTVRTIW